MSQRKVAVRQSIPGVGRCHYTKNLSLLEALAAAKNTSEHNILTFATNIGQHVVVSRFAEHSD